MHALPLEKGEPVFVWVILFTAGYDFYVSSGDRATRINMYHIKSIMAYVSPLLFSFVDQLVYYTPATIHSISGLKLRVLIFRLFGLK